MLYAVIFLFPLSWELAWGQTGGTAQTGGVIGGIIGSVPSRAPEPPKYKPDELCLVEGIVRNSVTGEPLKKANVVLYPVNRTNSGMPATTVTGAEGKFAMKSIEPGQYRLTVDRPGFVRMDYGAKPGALQGGTTLTLEKGQSMKSIEFKLIPHSVVTGRILDEDGDPVQSANVQLLRYRYINGGRQLFPSGSGATNDLGEFRVFGVSPGRYYVSATARNFMNYSVDRSASQQQDVGFAPTYYPGTNDIGIATQINVSMARTVQGMDITLRRTRTYRLSGNVMGVAGNNRSGMVYAAPASADAVPFSFDRYYGPWHGLNGEFEIRGLRPGSYVVRADYFEPPNNRLTARTVVELSTRDVEGVVLSLAPGADLRGSVRVSGDTPLNSGDLTVYLQPKSIGPMMGSYSGVVKDGGFVIPGVPPDAYTIRVNGAPAEFYVKSAQLGDVDVMEQGLELTQAGASGLELTLSPGAATVEGSAADSDGKPVRGAAVLLRPQSARPDVFNQMQKQVTTDQNGQFRIQGIPPGDYYLIALEGVDMMEVQDPELFKENESAAVKLTLAENAKETRTLKPAGSKDRQ